jgi:hypothetical protein
MMCVGGQIDSRSECHSIGPWIKRPQRALPQKKLNSQIVIPEGRDLCGAWAPAFAGVTRIGKRHFMEVLILKRGTLRSIIVQAGLTLSEFNCPL